MCSIETHFLSYKPSLEPNPATSFSPSRKKASRPKRLAFPYRRRIVAILPAATHKARSGRALGHAYSRMVCFAFIAKSADAPTSIATVATSPTVGAL